MKTSIINNGKELPILGLGTSKSNPNKLYEAVCYAIQNGYRHFDCAFAYNNEEIIGRAVNDKIAEGIVKRGDLFITGKLWRCFNNPKNMELCLNESLKRLKLEYFDLYLIHFPSSHIFIKMDVFYPADKFGKPLLDEETDYVLTWKNMNKFVQSGKVRSIGVSNFNKFQIERILKESDIVPAVNQIESHPYFNNEDLIKYCQGKGIHVTGYCPIGAADRPNVSESCSLLNDPILANMAKKYNKTSAQIALRFNIQRGLSVVPKSVTNSRILENINVFDFSLNSDDMNEIYKLERGKRLMQVKTGDEKHKYFPFRENYEE